MTRTKQNPVVVVSFILAVGSIIVASALPTATDKISATDPTPWPTETVDPPATEALITFPTQVPLGSKKPLWPTNVPYYTSTLPPVTGTPIPLQPTP